MQSTLHIKFTVSSSHARKFKLCIHNKRFSYSAYTTKGFLILPSTNWQTEDYPTANIAARVNKFLCTKICIVFKTAWGYTFMFLKFAEKVVPNEIYCILALNNLLNIQI